MDDLSEMISAHKTHSISQTSDYSIRKWSRYSAGGIEPNEKHIQKNVCVRLAFFEEDSI